MKNLRNRNHPPNADLVQVYLQSSWDIVIKVYENLGMLTEIGDAIDAGDLDDFLAEADIDTIEKLNAILTNADLGDFASQAEAEAGLATDKTMSPLRVAQAIAVFASPVLNNYNGVGPPTVNDDSSLGYAAGSVWIDTTAVPNEAYRCSDPTGGAAVWLKTTLTSDELALVALTGNSDDLLEGVVQLLMTVAERAKLLGIEAGATGDMTGAEIKIAYEGEANTNAYTNAEKSKLAGVETGADVTDAANVAAAGAVMDSDFTPAEGMMQKTGAGAYTAIKTNLNAATDPGVGDDSADGYGLFSVWINTTANPNKMFLCKDATVGAAVWPEVGPAASGASTTQTTEMIAGFIASPSNKDYRIVVKMAHGGTATETTTRSVSGTCTATFKVNTTAFGGTANSVSSSEQSQAHASSNTWVAGDDIVITISANSTCVDMSFAIQYTRTLA